MVVQLTDETLFQCPMVMMTEVGAAYLNTAEAEALRAYVLKGGFVWADDFWGEYAWRAWTDQLSKALPPAEFPIRDLEKDHPLFRTLFDIGGVPQIASIGHWWGSGGGTSERGAESAVPHARAIFDPQGRMMVLMTHNTDIGDSWEEEASNRAVLLRVLDQGLRVRHQRHRLRDDALGSYNAFLRARNHTSNGLGMCRPHAQQLFLRRRQRLRDPDRRRPMRRRIRRRGSGSFTTGVSIRMSSAFRTALSTSRPWLPMLWYASFSRGRIVR